nr:MAG TPA: hypothetical protein [Caudoviricetes sp.]
MRRFCIIFAILLTVALLAYQVQELATPVTLSVPSCGIEVSCEYVAGNNSERLQAVVDKPHTAAWRPPYLMDHAGQDFRGLWNIAVGDEVVFGDVRYQCAFVTTGFSDRGIYTEDGQLPEADLYLCTCVPDGRECEIYIVGIQRR